MKHLFFAVVMLLSSVTVSARTVSESFVGTGLNAVAALYDHLDRAAPFMGVCIFLGGTLRGPTDVATQSFFELIEVDGELTGGSREHFDFGATWHCDLPE